MTPKPHPGKKFTVVIAEGAIVYVGERSYGAGESIELPEEEAKALVETGQALPPDAKPRRRRRKAS